MNERFPWIAKWGNLMHSDKSYIEDRLARAAKTRAPADACFEEWDDNGPTGQWVTTNDILDWSTRWALGLPQHPKGLT